MSSYNIIKQTFQERCHGTFGYGAEYQNENLRGRGKVNNRINWLPEAIERYSKVEDCAGISYNDKCNSVYLHTKIDQTTWRNNTNTTDENGKHSNKHKWHTLIVFNN